MTNIYMTVRGPHAQATAHGCLTSGMVGVPVKFEYSDIWDSLHKTAVFSAGGVTRDVADVSDSCTVPAEVLAKAGTILYVGVYGWRDDGTIVIPTIMAPVGMIAPGADPSGDPGTDPGLPIWAQIQQMVEKLKLDPEAVRQIVADYLANDAGVVTTATTDLENYYLKSETYNRDEIDQLVSQIPKFGLRVVAALPTADISDTTIYLVPGGVGSDLYTEYIYANGTWEILGSQRVDLAGYATEAWVTALLEGKLDADKLPEAIDTALAQAKESGVFDGKDGDPGPPGVSGVYVGPGDMPDGYNVQIDPSGDANEIIDKMIKDALTAAKESGEFDGKDGKDGADGQPGEPGKDYILTETDLAEIAELAAELVDVPDGGGGSAVWELVADIELEADVQNFEFTELNAKELQFAWYGRFNDADDSMGNAVQTVSVHVRQESWAPAATVAQFGYVRTGENNFWSTGELRIVAGLVECFTKMIPNSNTATSPTYGGRPHELDKLDYLKVATDKTTTMFKAGGKFRLYKR